MKDKIININSKVQHEASEVVCLKCLTRWISVRPYNTRLVQLECPGCLEQGFTIETGETIFESKNDGG